MTHDSLRTLDALSDPARIDFAKRSYPTKLQVIGGHQPEPTAGAT